EERIDLSRTEKALRRSEAYLAEAQKLSHTGSFGWDVSSGKIYWSQETFRIFGYNPPTEPTLDLVFHRTHPEDRPLVQQVVDRVLVERKDFDLEHRLLGWIRRVSIIFSTHSIRLSLRAWAWGWRSAA